MSTIGSNTEHHAINRLFDLASTGEVENVEFAQLDSMIYQRLMRAYDVQDAPQGESIS